MKVLLSTGLICLILFFATAQAEYSVQNYPDGGRYEGETLDGKRHGKGIYLYPNGKIYTGEWQQGKKHGWGLFKWPSGNRYEGEWRDNRRHGKGTFVFSDGGIHEGVWVNGKSQGALNPSFMRTLSPNCPMPPPNVCPPGERRYRAAGMCAWILGGCDVASRAVSNEIDELTRDYLNSRNCEVYVGELQSKNYRLDELVGSFIIELTQTIEQPLLEEAQESSRSVESLTTSAAGIGLKPFVGESAYAEFQSCIAEAEMECSRQYEQWQRQQVCNH